MNDLDIEWLAFQTRCPRLYVALLGIGIAASLVSLLGVGWLATLTIISMNKIHDESLQYKREVEGGDE